MPSAYLRATFDLDAAPEPWLPLFPGERPLVALTTNTGYTLPVALQRRADIVSGRSSVRPDASYAEAARALAAYYTHTLRGTARIRNAAMARLSQLAGFDGVLGVECCPFHSRRTPHKAVLVRESATDPLLAGYVGVLGKFLALGSVVAVSAVSTRATLCRGLRLSPWLTWQGDRLGLVLDEAECIPLVTKDQKVTCAALIGRRSNAACALVLMMGGNTLPGDAGLQRLARALRGW